MDVDEEEESHWLFGLLNEGYEVPDIPDHVEYTVHPVLEKLDELYKYTTPDTDIDIEVAMERVEHEMSWAEVNDEAGRISQEIDSIVAKSE